MLTILVFNIMMLSCPTSFCVSFSMLIHNQTKALVIFLYYFLFTLEKGINK